MSVHDECRRTEKRLKKAEKKAQSAIEDLVYWMRVMDTQPEEFDTANEWFQATIEANDPYVEANFQKLRKWSARSSAAYDAWNSAAQACMAHDEAKKEKKS